MLSIFIVLMSCQEHKSDKGKIDFKTTLEKKSKEKSHEVSKKAEPKKVLTLAALESFFPEKIGAYNRIGVGETNAGSGTATYIYEKDYGSVMYYFLNDGELKSSSRRRLFEEDYQSNHKWADGSERIRKERDGFRTVALLREQYNNYKISTLYNGRFILTVEGKEKPDVLWSYLKQADLKILDSY